MDSFNKAISEISSSSESNRITIFTNHLKIDGFLYQCNNKCKQVADGIITLNDAVVCKIDDYCSCNEDECSCKDFACFKYKWLNILQKQIVAFSILK